MQLVKNFGGILNYVKVHSEALKSETPVLAKLWYFWGNHFAISEKDFLAQLQQELIKENH